jgi:hypothetical protein
MTGGGCLESWTMPTRVWMRVHGRGGAYYRGAAGEIRAAGTRTE